MERMRKVLTTFVRAVQRAESLWFDKTRGVHTDGNVALSQAGIFGEQAADSKMYVPARAANIRDAIRAVPARDFAPYTFVDLGSGKGRALFIAAEFAFHRMLGVEFSHSLHEACCRNAASFRYRGRDASRITPLEQDATMFAFPAGPLVVYMFNPFGATTMQIVLDHLQQSLEHAPRHAVVILLWPVHGDLVARMPGMRRVCAHRRYEIYEAHAPLAPTGQR